MNWLLEQRMTVTVTEDSTAQTDYGCGASNCYCHPTEHLTKGQMVYRQKSLSVYAVPLI